ncbi:MAG TPA: A24 family peptidase [Burkholderiales bacterium]|nr:A24 family peptidase [Burkholderiales bacterium]
MGWIVQPAAFPWVALAFGLCIGSFLNVVIHRLPRIISRDWELDAKSILEITSDTRREWRRWKSSTSKKKQNTRKKPLAPRAFSYSGTYNLIRPRSGCPSCGHFIRWWENIPVLSYLVLLQGRCSNCGTLISIRYPLVEILAGIGTAWSASHFGFGAQAFAAAFFIWCTIALAFIDQETGYLFDDITVPLLWVGLMFNTYGTFVPLSEAVIGAIVGYLALWTINALFKLVRGIDGMGYGDFKMTAAVGAFVGWKYLFLVVLLSSCIGLVFGLLQMISARRGWDGKFKFHFGPYIAIAGIATMFYGQAMYVWVPALRVF